MVDRPGLQGGLVGLRDHWRRVGRGGQVIGFAEICAVLCERFGTRFALWDAGDNCVTSDGIGGRVRAVAPPRRIVRRSSAAEFRGAQQSDQGVYRIANTVFGYQRPG